MRNGLNAATGEYEDLVKAGVIDAAKVTRSALQNAASIAALFLTTEAVVADKPEEKGAGGMPGGGMPAAWAAWTSKSPHSAAVRRGALRGAPFASDTKLVRMIRRGRIAAVSVVGLRNRTRLTSSWPVVSRSARAAGAAGGTTA